MYNEKTERKSYISFEQALENTNKTKEEFLRLHNMPQDEREKLFKEMEAHGENYDWYIHLVIAYRNTYPSESK